MKRKINTNPKLTPKEKEIIPSLAQGKPDKQIADELNMKESTLRTHNQHIFRKTGITNRTELAALYYESLIYLVNPDAQKK